MLRGLNLSKVDFDLAQLSSFIAGFDNYYHYILGIFDSADDRLVGFYTIDVNRTHKTGSLTTGIGDTSERGKRTLWSTIDAILDHFYAERDIEKFTARILARNYAMLFNFKNNTRFTLEAHLKRECIAPDGKRVDLLVFASFKDTPPQIISRHTLSHQEHQNDD
jgi:RimJ/RimL family protein N-acetyltransferase